MDIKLVPTRAALNLPPALASISWVASASESDAILALLRKGRLGDSGSGQSGRAESIKRRKIDGSVTSEN